MSNLAEHLKIHLKINDIIASHWNAIMYVMDENSLIRTRDYIESIELLLFNESGVTFNVETSFRGDEDSERVTLSWEELEKIEFSDDVVGVCEHSNLCLCKD